MSASQESNARHQATPATADLSHSMFVRSGPTLRLAAASLHSPVVPVFRVRRQKLSLRVMEHSCRGFSRVRWRSIVRRDRLLWFAQIHRLAELCFVLILQPIV